MKDFKLGVQEGKLDQRVGGEWRFGMPEGLPAVEMLLETERRGGHKGGLFDGCAGCADPVLGGAEAAATFVMAAHAVHEGFVELEQGVQAEGTFLKKVFRQTQCAAVVDDLVDLFAPSRLGRDFAGLVFQHLLQVSLRALDSRGKDRFLRGERGEQNVRVGNAVKQAVEAGNGAIGATDEGQEADQIEVRWRKLLWLKWVHRAWFQKVGFMQRWLYKAKRGLIETKNLSASAVETNSAITKSACQSALNSCPAWNPNKFGVGYLKVFSPAK